jgi:hypothetical protein
MNSTEEVIELKQKIEKMEKYITELEEHLKKYTKKLHLPELNETFILYCIKSLGLRDNRGKKGKDTELLETLEHFYKTEYAKTKKSYSEHEMQILL